MPPISLPLMKGSKTTVNARYDDALPVNMLPVPAQTENANGYLRSFKGIELDYVSAGISYGAQYNSLTGKEYRVLGNKLVEDGAQVATVSGGKLTSICHSAKSVCFVDGGKVKYWRDGKLTELTNWTEGENYVSYPDFIFTVKSGSYITIPAWKPSNGFNVNATVYYKTLPTADEFIISSKRTDNKFCGIYYKASDKKFYHRITDKETQDIEIQTAVAGENSIRVSSLEKYAYPIELIRATQKSAEVTGISTAQITDLQLFDHVDASIFRIYPMTKSIKQEEGNKPATPTTKVIDNSQDESGVTAGRLVGSWDDYHKQSEPFKSPATAFDLSDVIDVDRHKGRYVWINKRRFGCTALTIGSMGSKTTSPEQRPDYGAPFYSPEHDSDDNKAIRSWNNYVVVFGRNSIEFFRLTGNSSNLYVPEQSMVTEVGVVATHAVCEVEKSFAALGSTKGGTLMVMMVSPGNYQKISTSTVDRVIAQYKESELQDVLLETVMMDNHNLLFVHLPNETLVLDLSQNVWITLKSSVVGDGPYRGRHILYNQKKGLTIGDKQGGNVGLLTDAVASQYGENAEHILYTPYIQVNDGYGKVPLHRLKFDSIYGHTNVAQSMMISATLDGRTYGKEHYVTYNTPLDFTNKVILGSLGAVEKSIGFKLRVVSKQPVHLSGFSVDTP
ncbi:packaged DNA stabilization protein [Vibrio sp. SCSIO 43136]|uniref:packaged DNA stabilization protein n=1 Tax=Vibrio sp. SCSIO 43136 TaxID=2819101 RepID=UPI0020760A8D|nr:packaged DNA stabilization protein [Vibrio sp. SCSIO 43136]USD64211.1 hypothetical protein J4N39_08815 [Vibrio sp. SCSIO 43136]